MSDNCRSISHPRDNVNQKTVQHMENCSINMVKKITREWGKDHHRVDKLFEQAMGYRDISRSLDELSELSDEEKTG